MKRFNKLKIKTKIFIGFGIIFIIGLVLGFTGIVSTQILLRETNHMIELNEQDGKFKEVLIKHYLWKSALIESVLNGSEFTGSIDPDTCALGEWLHSENAKKVTDPEILSLLTKIKDPHAYMHYEAETVANYIKAGETELAKRHLDVEIQPRLEEIIKNLNIIAQRYDDLVTEGNALMVSTERLSTIISITSMAIAAVMAIIISSFLSGGIMKDLKKTIAKLMSISQMVRNSADQISGASESLAAGSASQAAATEETAAAMNETESMIAQNTENTRAAARIAAQSTQEMDETGKYMEKMMETMAELKESSDKVSKIIKTIDKIASKTNILALNASVEAVRAGDAGRSFTVVAEEVRELAQESASASAETAEIIEKNMELTDASRADAERVILLAKQNAEHSAQLSKLISEITAASEEQAHGVKQINIAISQVEKTTQENAAIAEENSAASIELHNDVVMLDEAIEEEAKLI